MTPPRPNHVVIVGAGAAGLMAARELVRAGRRVTILEARERCGGRIYPLSAVEFGYPAEAGAEFVHGEASLTRAVLREARLSLSPVEGRRWRVRDGAFSRSDAALPHAHQLSRALAGLDADLPIAEFLERHFVGRQYGELRRVIERMVEGYDAADPARASTFALRSEWLGHGPAAQGRIAGGYGALIDFLAAECRVQGVSIHLGAEVKAIEASGGLTFARCRDGSTHAGEAMILTVPLPLLSAIALPSSARAKAAVRAEIGFGNVVKILLRFETRWWEHVGGKDLTDLSFLHSGTMVPTWWTQYPAEDPVLTGWFAGPKTASVAQLAEDELIELALASLAEAFRVSGPSLKAGLLGARAINWANDPFARGAYSYATLGTREAQSLLAHTEDGAVFYSGEALYRGPEMGTVEAALASGLETARMLLAAGQ